MRAWPLAALLCFTAASSFTVEAQTLRGRVIDAASRNAVAGAEVSARTPGSARFVTRITTDSLGRFSLELRDAGRYIIETSRIGYATTTSDVIKLNNYEAVEMEIGMSAAPVPLEAVRVLARRREPNRYLELNGFYARQSAALGQFLTRDDIDRHASPGLSDVLRSVRGARLVRVDGRRSDVVIGRAYRPGRCIPAIFMDGALARPGGSQRPTDMVIDDMVMARDVEGIEIYAGPAQSPGAYSRFADCGLILIWTKRRI